jgi:hypothetical protein
VASSGSLEVLIEWLLARVRELESVVHRGGVRGGAGRAANQAKQSVSVSVSQMVDEPDEKFEVCPDRYARCKESLDNAFDTVTVDTVRVHRRWRMWIPIITVSHRVPPGVTALRRVRIPSAASR